MFGKRLGAPGHVALMAISPRRMGAARRYPAAAVGVGSMVQLHTFLSADADNLNVYAV